jgi:hypothetical protein
MVEVSKHQQPTPGNRQPAKGVHLCATTPRLAPGISHNRATGRKNAEKSIGGRDGDCDAFPRGTVRNIDNEQLGTSGRHF